MTIATVYQNYQIPPNLQRHQLQVAAVVKFLQSHWSGPAVQWQVATLAALLHDMGNILKFKRPFLGELEPDAQRWLAVQDQFQAKYGSDVHTATRAIIVELISPDQPLILKEGPAILDTIDGMKRMFVGSSDVSWATRAVEYADSVVTPRGIENFETRMADLIERYPHKDAAWHAPFRKNADLIAPLVKFDLDRLGDVDFSLSIKSLQEMEV